MPEKPAPTAAPATPGVATVHPGYDAIVASAIDTAETDKLAPASNNWVSWVALFFGVTAVALTFVNLLPGSTTLWVAGAGVAAVLCGLLAILRRMRRLASNTWAPIVGILFGLGATAVVLLGVNMVNVVVSATGGTVPTSSASADSGVAPLRPVSHEPFVFAANAALTADGTEVQQIATAINRTYASGNSVPATSQTWPRSLKFSATQILTASGKPLVTVAAGHFFTYTPSANLKSYTFAVSSSDMKESASYSSAADRFTFSCPASDATCVPDH